MLNHQALAHIRARLQTDGHAELLKKIPARLFTQRNGNILLDLPLLCGCDIGFSPVFAFLLRGRLHADVTLSSGWQRLMASSTCLEVASQVDPFAKLPLELLVQGECQYSVFAMLEYYLLVCAVEARYEGSVPVPKYDHLEGMVRMLERAREYWPVEEPGAHGMGMLIASGAHGLEEGERWSGGREESVPRSLFSDGDESSGGRDESVPRSLFSDREQPPAGSHEHESDEPGREGGISRRLFCDRDVSPAVEDASHGYDTDKPDGRYKSVPQSPFVGDETPAVEDESYRYEAEAAERHGSVPRSVSDRDESSTVENEGHEYEADEPAGGDDGVPQFTFAVAAFRDESHGYEADEPAGRDDAVPCSLHSRQVTPEVPETQYKSVETVVPEGLQSHNSDTSDDEDEQDFTTHNTLAVMEPNETLRNLRSEIDESMLQYLPGITALYFGKDDTHSEYLPLALRLGIFLDESEEHPGCSAWAYFKLQEAALELYVCHDPEGQYYIEGGAQTSLSRHYHDISFDDEFESCNTAKDVVALTKYFFLLAAETRNEKQYGLFSPDFPYNTTFSKTIVAICNRLHKQSKTSEQKARSSSRQTTLVDRTSPRTRRVSATPKPTSNTTHSSDPDLMDTSPNELVAQNSSRSSSSNRRPQRVVAPPQLESPRTAGGVDHDEAAFDASTEVQFAKTAQAGSHPESSEGEDEIHWAPPKERDKLHPDEATFKAELARKKTNLEAILTGHNDNLAIVQEQRKKAEKEIRKLTSKKASVREIESVQARIGMMDVRIKKTEEDIGVFERTREENEGKEESRRKQMGKGKGKGKGRE